MANYAYTIWHYQETGRFVPSEHETNDDKSSDDLFKELGYAGMPIILADHENAGCIGYRVFRHHDKDLYLIDFENMNCGLGTVECCGFPRFLQFMKEYAPVLNQETHSMIREALSDVRKYLFNHDGYGLDVVRRVDIMERSRLQAMRDKKKAL